MRAPKVVGPMYPVSSMCVVVICSWISLTLAPVDGDAGDTAVDRVAKARLSLVREQGDDIPMLVRREVATALLVDTPSPDPGGTTAPKVTGSKGNPAK
jgi:hypothetical protein